MNREEVLAQARQALGLVPGWLDAMPEGALEQYWGILQWLLDDTKLPAREKVLVAYGAASALHCQY